MDPLTGSVSLTRARSLLKVFFSKSGLRKTSPTSLKKDRKLEADLNCDTGSERLISTLIPEVEADLNCDTGSERLISTLIPEVRG